MRITALYAGLLGLLLVVLSLRVIIVRYKSRTALGDAGDERLRRRIRVQGNFAEYAPLAILLIAINEHLGMVSWGVHALGAALVLGRCSHAFGVSQHPETLAFRQAGMVTTFTVIIIASLFCIRSGLSG